MSSEDTRTVTNRTEVTDANRIHLTANSHVIPNGGPLAHNNVADEGSIGSDPGIINLRNGVVKWHALTMTGRFLQVGDILGKVASDTIKLYNGEMRII